jgi:hypothetical protein
MVVALAATLVPSPAQANSVQTGNTKRVLGGCPPRRSTSACPAGSGSAGTRCGSVTAPPSSSGPTSPAAPSPALQTMPTMISREYSRKVRHRRRQRRVLPLPPLGGARTGCSSTVGRQLAGDAVMSSGGYVPRAVAGIASNGAIIGDKLRVTMTLDAPEAGARRHPQLHDINRAPLATQTDRRCSTTPATGLAAPRVPASLVPRPRRDPAHHRRRAATGVSASASCRPPTAATRSRRAPASSSPAAPTRPRSGSRRRALRRRDHPDHPERPGSAADWQPPRRDPRCRPAGQERRRPVRASHNDQAINHATTRRARTAVGRHRDGLTLLVTVDEGGGSPA